MRDVEGLCLWSEGEIEDGGGESLIGLGSLAFELAGRGAAIVTHAVAVIAGFTGVLDSVTTASEGTIGSAASTREEGVVGSIIAVFSGLDEVVTAGGELVTAGGSIAGERGRGSVFTLLVEERLDNAIAAETLFEPAVGRAAIEVDAIGIIAFFVEVEDTIGAEVRGNGGGSNVGRILCAEAVEAEITNGAVEGDVAGEGGGVALFTG